MSSGEGHCTKCGKPTLYGRHLHNEPCNPCPRCERIGLRGKCPHRKDQIDSEGREYQMSFAGEREYYEEPEVWGL